MAVHRKLIDDVLALTNRTFEGVRYRSQLGERLSVQGPLTHPINTPC